MMSKNTNKSTRSQLPRRSTDDLAGQPANPNAPDMSGNDREFDSPATPAQSLPSTRPGTGAGQPSNPDAPDVSASDRDSESSDLTPRQQAVLPVIALSPSIAQAARDTGVSERTLRRWLDDPAFRDELSQLHKEAYDLARKQLQALMPHLISVLAKEAMENPDATIRIRASRYALTYASRFCDFDRLADDVRDLRGAILNGK